MDVTYVAPFEYPNSYTIIPNPEAFMDVGPLIDRARRGEELKLKTLDRETIVHKGMEWYKRGQGYDTSAAELERSAALLTGEAKVQKLNKAKKLRYKAHGCYVEGTRQITKCADNFVKPRAEMYELKYGSDPYTREAREMVAAGKMVQDGVDPKLFYDYLDRKYHLDFKGFSENVANCLE